MPKIDKPHCSKLDRIFACPGSILPADAPKEAGGPLAISGRAKHEALSYIPRGIVPPVDEIVARYAVDRDEIELAVRLGEKAWRSEGIYFPDPWAERQLESSVCMGTSDLVQVVVDAAGVVLALRVLDWKTGWGEDLHPYQMKGYADGAVEEFGWPRNDVVSCFEVHTAHQGTRTTNLSREDLEEFRAGLALIIKTAEETPEKLEYRAGGHCGFCPHRPGCATRQDWLRSSMTGLVEISGSREITRDDIGAAYLRWVDVTRACAQFEAMVKAALDEGSIPLPDGRRVAYVESEQEKIAAGPALAALRDRLTEDDRAEILGDLTKSSLDRWAKNNTARGGKAALMREIYKTLRDADAIRSVPKRRRKVIDG